MKCSLFYLIRRKARAHSKKLVSDVGPRFGEKYMVENLLPPHITVAYGNTKESFGSIWNYLQKLQKPGFDLTFDNIAIMRKGRKYWRVHKVYTIK
jgi:hypothetical protein|tara:strand:- start:145 stop:429 length:285 start_codon:yes stop_codon:yes gene_type:complete